MVHGPGGHLEWKVCHGVMTKSEKTAFVPQEQAGADAILRDKSLPRKRGVRCSRIISPKMMGGLYGK